LAIWAFSPKPSTCGNGSLRPWAGPKKERGLAPRFLNLFAYSGGATLAAALAGAQCCHLDASRGMVEWARGNAALNGLEDSGTRFIVDDVSAFLKREVRRGRKYDCVLLDPPSFGRGKRGELYKVEKNVQETLDLVRQVLSDTPLFVILTSHTPGFFAHRAQEPAGAELRNGRLGVWRNASARSAGRAGSAQRHMGAVGGEVT
jgi:Predicted SAM-dependent methyltransferases